MRLSLQSLRLLRKPFQANICDSLGLKEPAVISQTLDRPNIFLSCSKSKGLNVTDYVPMHLCRIVGFSPYTVIHSFPE